MNSIKRIKYLVMDVDGTLTDGKIYMGCDGELCKAFSIKDGYGIHDIAIPAGIIPVVITGRQSEIVAKRCFELGVMEVYQGIGDKLQKLKSIVSDLSLVAYIGDDLNDFSCMKVVKAFGGVVGCPNDASSEIFQLADFVSTHAGGDGAVRDFIEWIMVMKKREP